jgi:CRP-like cAMP-binding protein
MDVRKAAAVLIRKLDSITRLSEEEKAALSALPIKVRQVPADEIVVREGDRPSECCLVVEGFTCRFKLTGEGKRQIHAFHTPGDIPDLQSLHLRTMDHSLGTLTPCTLGFISHQDLRPLCRAHPAISDALWRDTLIDAAIFREWMTSIGRRDAKQRIAHVLCELLLRLDAVGLVQNNRFAFPITQAELADALGLSTVHVNRTLQELRGEGLITVREGAVEVLDRDGLEAAGDFDQSYLHQDLERVA